MPMLCTVFIPDFTSVFARSVAPVKSSAIQPSNMLDYPKSFALRIPVAYVFVPGALQLAEHLGRVGDGIAAADGLFEAEAVLFFHLADTFDHLPALVGQLDGHGAFVVLRALLLQIAVIGQLLDVVGNIRTLVIAALDQVADDDLVIADLNSAFRGSFR